MASRGRVAARRGDGWRTGDRLIVAPTATYRLQLGSDLDLAAAAGLVGYLADLGVSHVYCSPFLQSAPDSDHGYAVVEYGEVDVRLGGEEGRRQLIAETRRHDLGLVIDLVPNHMAVSLPHNRWFWDVLEHGPAALHAGHFDIDWDPPGSATNRVLLTVLGDHYGREIEAGHLSLHHRAGEFTVRYHDQRFPASPRSVAWILARAAEDAGSDDLAFAARALADLPPATVSDPASRARRRADAEVLSRFLRALVEREDVRAAIDAAVDEINRHPDDLDEVLELQNYRLARWQTAAHEIGYRRFFDIHTLIGIRVEDAEVFEDSHRLVLDWVARGEVDGLRIDHPDGLRRPGDYLDRLRAAAPSAWIVVEKILEAGETLPATWPVDGTTGYDFLRQVTTLLVDPAGEEKMTATWDEFAEGATGWEDVADTAKREVLHDVLAADLNRLTGIFADVCQRRRNYRDFSRRELSDALSETIVRLDVYRTYVHAGDDLRPEDRTRISEAVAGARSARPDLDPEIFGLLAHILRRELDGPPEAELRLRFQQLTGPVMAKGVEDTAFYRYLRLAALCEVGGDPGRFGYRHPDEFHQYLRRTASEHPRTMLALSTHDTKRSEDVRARLVVLSEIPDRWDRTVGRWRERNRRHRPETLDSPTEYLVYQTLVGAHPLDRERLWAYLEKATKEAKTRTSWTAPDPEYDAGVRDFAARLAADDEFQSDLAEFVASIAAPGWTNALAQKAIQLTAPGVPDLYQGTELWDLSLVDPDNRRPVDHDVRRRLLDELPALSAETVLERCQEGLPKLWLIRNVLQLRHRKPDAFAGAYEPLPVSGPASEHAFAYSRGGEVAVVVPRLPVRLAATGGWADTTVGLPAGQWQDVLTGAEHSDAVAVREVLARFPVAVLARSGP